MQHLLVLLFGWLVAIVAVAGYLVGPDAAASIAGNSMRTVGITAGAVIGGLDDAMGGFNAANSATKTGPNNTGNRGGGGAVATRDGR